jgi:hypothetical protein
MGETRNLSLSLSLDEMRSLHLGYLYLVLNPVSAVSLLFLFRPCGGSLPHGFLPGIVDLAEVV